ncbi:lysosomal aspartic protease isoform X3 [Halyomorpha halys]|nr:lysosomal aspartic protease-like isoform X3 [Halyomorpha halys]
MMYFDTSFSGLWVISNDCNWSYYVCYKKKHKYEKERSFSYQPDNYTGYGNYGQIKGQSLSIEGFFVLDTLWLDNSNDASDQQFLAATTFCTDSFLCMLDASLIPDGLFGLGFPSSDVMMGPPFLTVLDRGLISSPSFSLYINRTNGYGELIIGGIKKNYYDGDSLNFVNIYNKTKTWTIDIKSVTLDESELCHHKCTVIIDTGTSIIAVPLDVLKTIYKILKIDTPNPERLVPIPCDNITILPTLTFHIEDTAYNISGKDYVIQLSDICVIGFMENRNSNQWVLGYLFLKNFYTIFNYGTRQIGLANTK